MTLALLLLAAVLWFPAPADAERAGMTRPASRRLPQPPSYLHQTTTRILRIISSAGPVRASLDTAWVLDLLSGCLRAGLPPATALAAVADVVDGEPAVPLLASAARLELWAPDPWRPMADSPQFAEAAALARRSGTSGAPMARGFADLAERSRAAVADDAEATAQRAGVLISAPLGLCFLPAFVFLGLVPVIVGLAGPMFGGMS